MEFDPFPDFVVSVASCADCSRLPSPPTRSFAAVPIVYEEGRGWNSLVGSLPFLAVLLGALTAAGINIAVCMGGRFKVQ